MIMSREDEKQKRTNDHEIYVHIMNRDERHTTKQKNERNQTETKKAKMLLRARYI